MTDTERLAIVRARLRRMKDRADSLSVVVSILAGQLARQEAEIRFCVAALESPVRDAGQAVSQAA